MKLANETIKKTAKEKGFTLPFPKPDGVIAEYALWLIVDWLREVKNVVVLVYPCAEAEYDEYEYEVWDFNEQGDYPSEPKKYRSFEGGGGSYTGTYGSYDDALEAAILLALTLRKV